MFENNLGLMQFDVRTQVIMELSVPMVDCSGISET